ncbi:hypothetical protein [Microbacterium sp. A84]|uniref:hypothetical protein n=1 Tax=Microbacterium sp. A84 TaxID=3450715 RepID=UPI003F435A90
MGLFTQKPAEKSSWAALPGEPLEREGSVDSLPESDVSPLGLGLGTGVTSISFPVVPPEPADE